MKMDFIKEKIRVCIEKLALNTEKVLSEPDFEYIPCDYKKENVIPHESDEWKPFVKGSRLGGVDRHFWFRMHIDALPREKDKELFFSLKTGREGQ